MPGECGHTIGLLLPDSILLILGEMFVFFVSGSLDSILLILGEMFSSCFLCEWKYLRQF